METKNNTVLRVPDFIITGFDHLSYQKLLGFFIFASYVLILVCCCINMSLIIVDRHLHSPMYIFICNLAIGDIIFSTSCCITMTSVLLGEMKTISFNSCFTGMFFYHLGDVITALTLTWMAVDRMLAISLPLRYNNILTTKRCIVCMLATWVIAMLSLSTCLEAAHSIPYCQPIIKYVFCDYAALIRAGCVNPGPYFSIPIIVGWWLWILGGHFTFIFLTYIVIVWTVLRLSDKGTRKMFSTCIAHVIVVCSYYAPKLVSVLLTRVGVKLSLTERNAVLIVASTLPPLINPVTYCLTTKELRTRLIGLLTKKSVAVK